MNARIFRRGAGLALALVLAIVAVSWWGVHGHDAGAQASPQQHVWRVPDTMAVPGHRLPNPGPLPMPGYPLPNPAPVVAPLGVLVNPYTGTWVAPGLAPGVIYSGWPVWAQTVILPGTVPIMPWNTTLLPYNSVPMTYSGPGVLPQSAVAVNTLQGSSSLITIPVQRPNGDITAQASISATGNTRGLGVFRWHSTHVTHFVTQKLTGGSFTATVNASDRVWGTYHGTTSPGRFHLDYTVTGGSGRCAGSHGGGSIDGTTDGSSFSATIR